MPKLKPKPKPSKPAPKEKPQPKEPSKQIGEPGSALWFARHLGGLRGYQDPDSAMGELLAIGVRMSEADRRTLVRLLT